MQTSSAPYRTSSGYALSAVVGVLLAAAATFLTVQASRPDRPDTDRVATLWAERTAFVGDNSAVGRLIADTGLASAGSQTFALHTDARPYGVTVTFSSTGKDVEAATFEHQATELLGLVGNADYVEIVTPRSMFRLDQAGASKGLGFDVKALGTERSRLEAFEAAFAD